MIRICSYCNKSMGEKEPLENKAVSHGICPECYETEINNLKKEKDNGSSNNSQINTRT